MQRLLLLLLLIGGARAETYVVCAGVERYDDERISALRYGAADAKALAAAFRAAGVPPRNVTVLGSDEADAARRPTRGGLLRALSNVRGRAGAGDKLVVFFAGHGIEQDGEQYLLTVDTQRDLLADTALPMQLVNRALEGLRAGEVLFLIDACRNDPDAGRGDNDARLSEGLARGLRPTLQVAAETGGPSLVATLLACGAGERAYEDPASGHGAFTAALLRGLNGAAADADGQVRLNRLSDYVRGEVSAWATRQGKQQTPRLESPDGAEMVVAVPPPEPVVSVALANQPLAAVVVLLAEQYGAQIVLGEGVDPEAKVTGRLDNLPLQQVLNALVAACRLTVRREGRLYWIEGAEAQAAAPTDPPKAWRIDDQRRFVDQDGQPVFPVAVMGVAERWDPAAARRMAATLQAAGVELVMLRIYVGNGSPNLVTLPLPVVPANLDQDLAGLDNALAALREAGIKCLLSLNVLQRDDFTPRDSPIWSDANVRSAYLDACEAIAARYRNHGDTLVGMMPVDSCDAADVAGYADLIDRAAERIRTADAAMPLVIVPPYRRNREWVVPPPSNAMTGGEVLPYDNLEEMRLVLRPGACRLLYWDGIASRLAAPDLAMLERQMAPCRALGLIPIYCCYTLSDPTMPTAFAAFREQVNAMRQGR